MDIPEGVSQETLRRAYSMKTELENRDRKRNNQIAEMRQWRYNEKGSSIPAAFRGTATDIRVPLIDDVISRIVGIIDDAEWKAEITPYGPGQEAWRNSSLREKWVEGVFRKAEADLDGRPVITLVTDNQIADGLGVIKVVPHRSAWNNLPSARDEYGADYEDLDEDQQKSLSRKQERAKLISRLPWKMVDIDPLTYHESKNSDGRIDTVIEISKRPTRSVIREYGDKMKEVIRAAGEAFDDLDYPDALPMSIETWEYWDDECFIAFVDKVPVKGGKHDLGRPPYFTCVARPVSSRDSARAVMPPVYKLITLAQAIQNLMTMGQNVVYLFAYPTPVVTSPTGLNLPKGSDGRPKVNKWEPGKIMNLYEGQTFEFATPPIQQLEMIDSWMERQTHMFEMLTGLGPAMKGIGGEYQPGYALNQLMQASMLTIQPAVKSRDQMLSQIAGFFQQLVENIGDTVWVYGDNPDKETYKTKGRKRWLRLAPHEVGGYYEVHIQTRPLIDQMRIARGSFAGTMVERKLISRRYAIEEFLGIQDPDEMMDEIWVDEALDIGPLHDQAIMESMKRAGMAPPPPPPQPGVQQGMVPGMQGPLPPTSNMVGPAGPGVGMPLQPPVGQPPSPMTMEQQGSMTQISGLPPGVGSEKSPMPPIE